MPTQSKKVNYNDWKESAKSKLSKQKYIVKPETRELGTKTKSVEGANAILNKAL